MSKKEMDIEELIADARAEEEVKKQAEAEKKADAGEKVFRDELRKQISKALDDFIKEKRASNKVTIDLDEYITLKHKERDLAILLKTIIAELELDYSKTGLRFKDSYNIISALRAIHFEACEMILEELQAQAEQDEEKEGV